MLRRDPADACTVTWITPRHVIVAGLVACALAGLGIQWSTFHPPVTREWGWLYSSEKWDVVKASFARRGFDPDSVKVLTATTLTNGRQFAIISGRTGTGRTCLVVARGTAIGATICRISKPVMVFYARDTCNICAPDGTPMKTLSILGLIRGDVTITVSERGREGGLGGVPAGIGSAFNVTFGSGTERVLRARNATGRVLASFSLRHP
jgi:hypothetical protein